MKPASTIILILALSTSCFGIAQSANMKDMKGMDMKGMGSKPNANGSEADTHKTTAVVKGKSTYYYYSAQVLVVSQHVTHRYRAIPRVVREGDDDIVGFELN